VIAGKRARAAIWLTPKSVNGFNSADFPELGLDRQAELQTAVQNFLAVGRQVPANQATTPEQKEGDPAVWVNVFAEEGAPRSEFGRFASQIIPKIRQALSTEGVNRWPYVRLRTATEHKTA
jgi:hypothetical protein